MKKWLPLLLVLIAGCAKTHKPQPTAAAPPRSEPILSLNVGHVGPAKLYPDPDKTPGDHATLSVADLTKMYSDNCPGNKISCTYSQDHRDVNSKEHATIYDEYNVPADARNIKHGEVDHFYPLCAGGSNNGKNLWYQPITNEWNGKNYGFKEKDKLESFICLQIKNKKMDTKDAYGRITKDWVKFYLDEGLDKAKNVKDPDND
jgi:hypothetical protein